VADGLERSSRQALGFCWARLLLGDWFQVGLLHCNVTRKKLLIERCEVVSVFQLAFHVK